MQYQKISCQNENNRIKSKDQNVFSDDSIRRFSNDIKYADNLENVFDEFFNNEKNLPSAHNYVQNFQNSNEMNYNGAVDKDSISGLRKDIKKADDFEKANEKFPTADNFVQNFENSSQNNDYDIKSKDFNLNYAVEYNSIGRLSNRDKNDDNSEKTFNQKLISADNFVQHFSKMTQEEIDEFLLTVVIF